MELLVLCGQIKKGETVDVDFDHEFTPNEKFDAKFSYKKKRGYFPGIATVGNIIIGIENRDADTNVKFNQADTLTVYLFVLKMWRELKSTGSVLIVAPTPRVS